MEGFVHICTGVSRVSRSGFVTCPHPSLRNQHQLQDDLRLHGDVIPVAYLLITYD